MNLWKNVYRLMPFDKDDPEWFREQMAKEILSLVVWTVISVSVGTFVLLTMIINV